MQHINNFMGGMKGGVDYTLFPQDSYTYLLNGTMVSNDERGLMITDQKGTISIWNFAVNEVPVGTCYFDSVMYVFTLCPIGGINYLCLYSLKGCSATGWIDIMAPVLNSRTELGILSPFKVLASLFGYTTSKLLDIFAKDSYDGSVDLYICDGLNPNVIINTGIDKDGIPTKRFYSTAPTKEVFFQQTTIANVPEVVYSVEDYGNMKPGTYYLYIRYEDQSLNATPFIKEIGPIFIHAGNTLVNNASGVTNDGTARVSKRIRLAISNTDPNFKYVSVGVVYYYGENGLLSRDNYLIDKSFSLSNLSTNIIIDGDNAQRVITVEELLSDNIHQNICETHTQLDGHYYGANWKGKTEDLSMLKELANRFIPHAIIKDEDNFDKYVDEDTKELEYMEEEIYPLGVSFLIDGQFKTDVFPIHGWYENSYVDYLYQGQYDSLRKYSINDSVLSLSDRKYYKNTTGLNRSLLLDFIVLPTNSFIVTKKVDQKFLYINSYTYTSKLLQYVLAIEYENVYIYNSYIDDNAYVFIQIFETVMIFNYVSNITFYILAFEYQSIYSYISSLDNNSYIYVQIEIN